MEEYSSQGEAVSASKSFSFDERRRPIKVDVKKAALFRIPKPDDALPVRKTAYCKFKGIINLDLVLYRLEAVLRLFGTLINSKFSI